MTERPPGFLAVPTPVAAALVAVGVRLLPADSRERYRSEFRAELCTIPRIRQITEAASLLGGVWALRRVLSEVGTDPGLSDWRSLRCRWGLHRYQLVNDDNPENRKYQHRECVRCGRIRENKDDDFPKNKRLFITGGLGGG